MSRHALRSRNRLISATAASISAGWSPAITSSRNSTVGRMASARASSIRLRSSTFSLSAAASARWARADELQDLFGLPPRLGQGTRAAVGSEERAHHDVLEHGEVAEGLDHLKGTADAAATSDTATRTPNLLVTASACRIAMADLDAVLAEIPRESAERELPLPDRLREPSGHEQHDEDHDHAVEQLG
jgi:hypothetical protein